MTKVSFCQLLTYLPDHPTILTTLRYHSTVAEESPDTAPTPDFNSGAAVGDPSAVAQGDK
jgi:hypothetical protein